VWILGEGVPGPGRAAWREVCSEVERSLKLRLGTSWLHSHGQILYEGVEAASRYVPCDLISAWLRTGRFQKHGIYSAILIHFL
jgi:hypothetical protein